MNIKLDWILTNEIAIGSAPKTFEDINYLKVNGIHGILSLCSCLLYTSDAADDW